MDHSTGVPPRRYEEIDVLRGFAALWVVLSHYFPHWNEHLGSAPVIVPNPWGFHAVELFFVISGFVIFLTLERCRSVTQFAVLRFSRLYPAYWATLTFATLVGVFVFGGEFWAGGFLTNATMVQEFLGYPDIDVIYWSLAVELAFYANAALLLGLGLHRYPQRVVAIWLACACVWSATLQVPGIERADRDWFARLFVLDHAPYFALGILFYSIVRQGLSASRLALIGFAIVTELLIDSPAGAGVAVLIAIIFALAISGRVKFLISRTTLWLGAISYSLYLIHRNLGYQVLDWMHAHGVAPLVAVPLTIAGALALATASTWLIEKPALTLVRTWYASRRMRVRVAH
jgi:peptidoglycan/LPS O-acetylase OafA/YrhL